VEFVAAIPKTASGKILRRVLIEAERGQPEPAVLEDPEEPEASAEPEPMVE
jgi:acyl-CoA synthetase (AMP-forming)/AMP-acid ligase II